MADPKITEAMVQRMLFLKHRSSSAVLMPNYTPRNWWECDVFRVTNAGYFYEYEIKLTRGDFKADEKKAKRYWQMGGSHGWGQPVKKWEKLGNRDRRAPRKFYFITPEGMVEKSDVPEFAGLIQAGAYLKNVKSAPILNKEKIDDEEIRRAISVGYIRYTWHVIMRANPLRIERG